MATPKLGKPGAWDLLGRWKNELTRKVVNQEGLDPTATPGPIDSIWSGLLGVDEDYKTQMQLQINDEANRKQFERQLTDRGLTYTPYLSKDVYAKQIIDYDRGVKKDDLELIQGPQRAQQTEATNARKESNKLTREQMLINKLDKKEDRLARIEELEASDLRAQQQWARQMEYEDKKAAASKEEKALEALVAGLASIGAGFA